MVARVFIVISIILFGTSLVKSEEHPKKYDNIIGTMVTIDRLKEYKITSMDLGVILLDQDLERFFSSTFKLDKYDQYTTNYGVWSKFYSSGPSIGIYVHGRDYPVLDSSWDFKDECRQVIRALRIILGYIEIDGVRQWRHSLIMQTFQKVYPLDDDDLIGDISNVVYLEFIRKIEGKIRKCSGSIVSDHITFDK